MKLPTRLHTCRDTIAAVYDNGGETVDRYTIVIKGESVVLGVSDDPDDYMGYSNWGEAVIGNHLGKKIAFGRLPKNVQSHVLRRLCADNYI